MENNIIRVENRNELQDVRAQMDQTTMLVGLMAESLRAMQEQMAMITTELHRLQKVTRSQDRALRDAIRDRARSLCEQYRIQDGERTVSAAIRKGLKISCGISRTDELPRADWATAMHYVESWNDYSVLKKARARR